MLQNKNMRAPNVLEADILIKTGIEVPTMFIVHLLKNISNQKMLPVLIWATTSRTYCAQWGK